MKTEIKKNGNTITVTMNGKLNFESQVPLKDDLLQLIEDTKKDSVPRSIIFDSLVNHSGRTSQDFTLRFLFPRSSGFEDRIALRIP